MTTLKPRPGDVYVLDVCTTTDWQTARDVKVTVQAATRLGCGCWRIEATRPGPADAPLAGRMEHLVNRCVFHAVNHTGYGPEATRIEATA